VQAVTAAMASGQNQYPPMPGILPLRQAVAAKIEALHGYRFDAASEITVTAGATQAIITIILAVVRPGDEVIVLEPCYDSYVPNIELAGGRVVRVPLTPGTFRPDFDKISAALNSKTRAILINSPHNPSATIWSREDMLKLQELLAPTETLLISDEVYEHMVFDGRQHESVARYPSLAARAFIVSSFGKTFHVTGWKVGTVAAPASLTAEFRKVHQFNVFTVNTPMQHGLAHYLADPQALPGAARVLPKEARLLPRRPGGHALQAAAQRRQLLPVCRHLRHHLGGGYERIRVLPLAHLRDRRGGDSAVGVLWRPVRPARGALLLRQEGRDASGRAGTPGQTLDGFSWRATSRPARANPYFLGCEMRGIHVSIASTKGSSSQRRQPGRPEKSVSPGGRPCWPSSSSTWCSPATTPS
jgi:histidinol-phosphate/aromatic aminotransferase/cobyric acid decarboxylase-like protein